MSHSDHQESDRSTPDPIRRFTSGGRAADAGWTLSGSLIGCLVIGYLVGEYFDWNPGATIAGLIIGLIVGMYNLAKVMRLFG